MHCQMRNCRRPPSRYRRRGLACSVACDDDVTTTRLAVVSRNTAAQGRYDKGERQPLLLAAHTGGEGQG